MTECCSVFMPQRPAKALERHTVLASKNDYDDVQELAGVTGAGSAAGAIVELHAMELEGYGPFRWPKTFCQTASLTFTPAFSSKSFHGVAPGANS